MGLFDKRRPQEEQETAQADWQADRARVASFLYRARTFNGTGPEDPTLTIKLKSGERALLVATGTFLVEPRRVPARWSGEKGGFTFRVAPRAENLTGNAPDAGLVPVDSGDLTFTDKRIVFSGTHKSVEWEYSELLGLCHIDHPPWTAVAVSGRERVSGFRYDESQAEEVRFAIVLGLARFSEALDSLLADLQEQLDEIDRAHPAAPVNAPGAAPAQAWQQHAAPAPGAPAAGAPAGVSGAPAGAPSGSLAGAASAPSWPPANPFSASPAGAPPVTPGAAAAAASSVPKPSSNYMPDDRATVIDGMPPGVPGQQQPGAAENGAPPSGVAGGVDPASGTAGAAGAAGGVVHPPSPGSGEVMSRAFGEDVTTEPKPDEDTGVPTGQIPAVTPTPTATYPAVRPQPATPLQPVQQPQQPQQPQTVHQGVPSTPPGWYPDPWRVARVRWWDGYSWTSYTSH
jgi:hypothetical protein